MESKSKKKNRVPYLLILPAVMFMIVVYLYPLVLTFKYSFFEVSLMGSDSTFVGLENFERVMTDKGALSAIFRTLRWVALTVAFKIGAGFAIALLLNSRIKGAKLYRFLVLVPWAIPSVVVSIIWSWIFDGHYGYLNYYLMKFKIVSEPIHWLAERNTAFLATSVVDSWAGIPLITMIMLSGLNAIPESLYEAADVDGANSISKFVHVTFPGVRKVVLISTILTTIWTFNSYNIIWVLTEGGPVDSTTTMVIKIYKEAFGKYNLGMSSTISIMAFVILTALSLVYWRFLNKKGEGI